MEADHATIQDIERYNGVRVTLLFGWVEPEGDAIIQGNEYYNGVSHIVIWLGAGRR